MGELRFYKKKYEEKVSIKRRVITWCVQILIIVILAWSIVFLFGEKTTMLGQSMSSDIENGDTVFINKFSYLLGDPKRNDVIVFKPNGNNNSHYYIKRVIGLPGETIQIKDGSVYIDGEEWEDDDIDITIQNSGIAETEVVLGDDEYFVLGDNRNNSEDSRYANIGNISKEDIAGKAWLCLTDDNDISLIK